MKGALPYNSHTHTKKSQNDVETLCC